MEKQIMVREGALKTWQRQIKESVELSGIHKDSREHSKLYAVGTYIKNHVEYGDRVKMEHVPGVTKKEVMDDMNLDYTFDYAIPQPWADDVYEKTGVYPSPFFVWGYPEGIFGGQAVAITDTGKMLLEIYNHILERTGHK